MDVARARRTTVHIAMAFGLLAQVAGMAPPSARGAGTALPFTTFADMHVDQAHGRVFVTGGPGTDGIHVFDFDGRKTGVVSMAGPADMVAGDGQLYVAVTDADAISVVDLASLEVTDSVSVAPYGGPRYLSKSNDTIYFSHSCAGEGVPGFASVDLATRVPLSHEPPNPSLDRCAQHAVAPSDPATLLAWDDSGSALRRYDVSARQPVLDGESTGETAFDEIAFSDEEGTFYALAWVPPDGRVQAMHLRMDDFTPLKSYPRAGVALSLTPDERFLFGGNVDGIHSEDVYVYRTGTPVPLTRVDISQDFDGDEIQPGALGTTAAGDRVFAVSREAGSPPHDVTFRALWPSYPVATGRGDQSGPAAGGAFEVWSQQLPGAPFESLVAREGGRTFRVSPPGTNGFAGGVDGTRLVYQVWRGKSSDLRLYDLARRRQISSLGRLNTPGWEWRPTLSEGRVLFSRYRGSRELVVLHTLRTGRERILANVSLRAQQAVAGQLSGQYAVWSQCYRSCSVHRMNLATGQKVIVPGPKGRLDYAPAVTRAGVVYFGRSALGCGADASIMRYSEGRVTEIQDLPLGQDVFTIYAVPGTDEVLYDRVKCRTDAWDVLRFRDVPR